MPVQTLSPSLKKAFIEFLEYTPAHRLNRKLRNMMVYYLISEQDGIPLDMNDLLYDLLNLFSLLDKVAEQQGTDHVV